MHVNIVYWISLHPKNTILPTFLGQIPYFISEKQKHGTNNLHHRNAGSIAVILGLSVGVQHIKKWRNNFSKASYRLYKNLPFKALSD